jgi:hypothetical protein
MKILLTLLCLLCTANLVQAELYKSTGEDGEVVYTDKPPTKDAKAFKPPAIQVTPPIKYVPKKPEPVAPKDPAYSYSDLHFSQPAAEANVYDNEGVINYELVLAPVLSAKLGHYLNIKLDGNAVASNTSLLTGSVNDVDRGSHTLTAEVCNKDGKVLRSASVTVHVHKATVTRTPPPTPAPLPTP